MDLTIILHFFVSAITPSVFSFVVGIMKIDFDCHQT